MEHPVFPPITRSEAATVLRKAKRQGEYEEGVKYLREIEERYKFLQDAVQEMGLQGFFDFCEDYEGFELPRDKTGNPDYEKAKAIFIQSAERADDLIQFIIDTYLGGEQRYGLSEFVKTKEPVPLIQDMKDNPDAFAVRRKLIFTMLFAKINQYFAKEQFEDYPIVYDRLEEEIADKLNELAPELFILSEDDKTPESHDLKMQIFLDPTVGNRVRIIEIEDEEPKVLHYTLLEESIGGEDTAMEKWEEILGAKNRMFSRTLNLKVRYLKDDNGEPIPTILSTRAKPFRSFALKMRRRKIKDPSLITDRKGIRFTFLDWDDLKDGLALIQSNFPVLGDYEDSFSLDEIGQEITIDGKGKHLRSISSSPKFQSVKWCSEAGIEPQITLLPFYLNENHTFAAESHTVYRALQYLEELLPGLFPFEEYGEQFSWRKELKTVADIMYPYFRDQYYRIYKERYRTDPDFKDMGEDEYDSEFPRVFYRAFLSTEFKRWFYDFDKREGLLVPEESDLVQVKEIWEDKYQELAKAMNQVRKNSNFLANIMYPDALKLDDSNWFGRKKIDLFGAKLVNAIKGEVLEIIADEVYKIRFGKAEGLED